VETFVAMRLMVDNWRWAGVPIFVRTGKRLKRRATEVSMVFQRPPHLPFSGRLSRNLRPDRLTLRIQPEEGVTLGFGAKVPGPAFQIQSVNMKFDYRDAFPVAIAEAYERLLLDAMIGDAMLFIRSDEVDQAWQIVSPIQEIFAEETPPLARYTAGTWGPLESDRLIGTDGHQWFNF
jgi:glucose-6-phosphate 1-dehydrogenase